ncbi:Alcohol dehydrogenase zinc-binding domain protein [Xylanimonas cellulosilytica DSM 15894]|uniref:Alcohol dehydrogenase zinc-binding domain protein n=1 Tax=Xylanimonas cellulosilytica (strain DSM 15894 / JCM 12276 / CECT 5975 / KCTC 9989 / LMG 20990 / NBRC 107835 / XIL07) TaxID=446471 RepID=D1BZB5_XYLCX|nr:zinc-binding dehydrogenase [Xylanimonas cellulosilytica]ACZ32012.1 Alcohol dehydrogenase zinc-binding domain protein [Xylanimonas cellulosilytica DSM 15894]
MLAAYAARISPDSPVDALEVGQRPDPVERENWSVVQVRAASLNHHDLWSLKGVGLREDQLPMILGTDAAGIAPDGSEVIVHGVVGADGHGVGPRERRTLLSEKYDGALAEYVTVPTANLLPKPPELTFAEAACLGTAWLTAYRMLFTVADLKPGQSVLVQGAGGGVATAAIVLGAAAGLEVTATSRSGAKRERALALGARHALEPGARVPARVDAVIESVGQATWSHSVRSVKPGGTIAVCGATSGDAPGAELTRVFFQELTVRGVTMGTREELAALAAFCARSDVRPVIDSTFALADAAAGLARLAEGAQVGKIVIEP